MPAGGSAFASAAEPGMVEPLWGLDDDDDNDDDDDDDDAVDLGVVFVIVIVVIAVVVVVIVLIVVVIPQVIKGKFSQTLSEVLKTALSIVQQRCDKTRLSTQITWF
jgi:hypothetical protein